jgi:catechol 2,3-dioxygenase-like lactoylglutathione lyase family enzyme
VHAKGKNEEIQMKRFHVHVSVESLQESIGFYSHLFGLPPSVEKEDYAKWMLDDPRINFAISQRGHQPGVNHLGFQVDTDEELLQLRQNVESAGLSAIDQAATPCCYAESNKHWVQDPQGIAWETFHTLNSIPVFGEDNAPVAADNTACCVPEEISQVSDNAAACCPSQQQSSCCN